MSAVLAVLVLLVLWRWLRRRGRTREARRTAGVVGHVFDSGLRVDRSPGRMRHRGSL